MIRIPRTVLNQLRSEGEKTYPNECCGVLLGTFVADGRDVRQAISCDNARTDSPRNRYAIEPLQVVRIQRSARENGLEIVGFYHSHPDHPAHWSETDLQEAHWLGCSYLITRVESGSARETNSFSLEGRDEKDKRFEDELLKELP